MSEDFREPFGGRYYGIVNVESDDPAPRILFDSENEARRELTRRQALDDLDDDWLSEECTVQACDVAAAIWNSFDPDPRADNPLNPDEILAVHEGPLDSSQNIVDAEGFIDALGDAVEYDRLPGIIGLDDEGERGGCRLLALVLNDDEPPTKIPIVVGAAYRNESTGAPPADPDGLSARFAQLAFAVTGFRGPGSRAASEHGRLAAFLREHFPDDAGQPGPDGNGESAIDVAIRLLTPR
jgi:hypothetical protein